MASTKLTLSGGNRQIFRHNQSATLVLPKNSRLPQQCKCFHFLYANLAIESLCFLNFHFCLGSSFLSCIFLFFLVEFSSSHFCKFQSLLFFKKYLMVFNFYHDTIVTGVFQSMHLKGKECIKVKFFSTFSGNLCNIVSSQKNMDIVSAQLSQTPKVERRSLRYSASYHPLMLTRHQVCDIPEVRVT